MSGNTDPSKREPELLANPRNEPLAHTRFSHDRDRSAIPLFTVLLFWMGIAWVGHIRYQASPVIPADSFPSDFSAERAESIFERLYKDTGPHPAGENEWFREKVIAEFRSLGYEIELQHCSDAPRNRRNESETVPLVNLIMRLIGKTDKPPVMLVAHYDSVPAGPGAGDDGAGLTALIEIARILRDEPPLERTIIFLITDGEELGLLGARRFVEEHELANQVAALINLEARGTTGPSLMFETSDDSGWLVSLFARTARRPFASSLFFEIYRFLPNSTDFTVFRQHGMRGFNFAFIGDVKNYHTPNDDFQTVDRRSLQHHGENALALIRELAETDIESQSQRPYVYFDVLGFFIVRWPAALSIVFSIVGMILVFWYSFWHSKQETRLSEVESDSGNEIPKGSVSVSVMLVSIGLVLVAIVGKLLDVGLSLDNATESPFPDHPTPIQASFWMFGLTTMLALATLAGKRLHWRSTWLGVWFAWSVFAVVTSLLLPGASYLLIVPLAGTGIAILMIRFVGTGNRFRQAVFVSVAGAVITALIWLPLERMFYDALGFSMNIALIFRVAITTTTLLPLMALCSRQSLLTFTVCSLLGSVILTLWAVIAN